jgi:hypothetical protein
VAVEGYQAVERAVEEASEATATGHVGIVESVGGAEGEGGDIPDGVEEGTVAAADNEKTTRGGVLKVGPGSREMASR